MKKPKREGNNAISVLQESTSRSIVPKTAFWDAVEVVKARDRLYQAIVNCFTELIPSGFVNALFHILLARSRIPFAVSCWMLYSWVTAIPSSKALREVATALSSISAFSAIVTITLIRREPSEPRSLKRLSRAKTLPDSRILWNIVCRASIPLPSFRNSESVPFAKPRSCSIEDVPFRISVISFANAVLATSGSIAILSTAAPRARISDVESAPTLPIARRRLLKSIIFPDVAVEVDASLKIALPVFNILCSTPILGISPITSVILESADSASSPRSSFNATFTWLAAFTNDSSPSGPYSPIPSFAPA